jgi:hypothetical protein
MTVKQDIEDKSDLTIDFITSSAIGRINLRFLLIYIPIFWLGGLTVMIYAVSFIPKLEDWIASLLYLPASIFFMICLFIIGCVFFSKLFLILINLLHKPKEGIFKAKKGSKEFEFWQIRIQLKKISIWLLNNCPLPWMDVLAFRWFGVKVDFSSHMIDAWVDTEFISFGRKVMIGQGAVVMSSMILGKYLIIKKVYLDDYTVVGGQTSVSPGTIIGQDTVLGALSTTTFNQLLEQSWIYFGFPARKLKVNKYAENKPGTIKRINVDDALKYDVEFDINIDEDKKDLINNNNNNKNMNHREES